MRASIGQIIPIRGTKIIAPSIESDEHFLQIEDSGGEKPDQDLLQGDLATQLQQALARLKPIDANLISLFYLQERSVLFPTKNR